MKKHLIQSIKIITLCLVFSTSVVFASVVTDFTFTPPSVSPPIYLDPVGVSAPINSSSFNQLKKGGLGIVNGTGTVNLFVFGNSEFHGDQSILSANNLYVSGRMGVGQGGSGTYVGGWFGPGPTFPGTLVPYDGGENPTRNLEIVNENNTTTNPVGPFVKSYMKVSSLAHTLAFSSPYSGSSKLREVCSDTSGKLILCTIPTLTPIPAACIPSNANPCSFTWNIPGTYYFIVPYNTVKLTIKTWGAGGGGSGGSKSSNANLGSGGDFGYGGAGGAGGAYTTQIINIPKATYPQISAISTVLAVKVGGGGGGSNGEPHDGSGIGPGAAGNPSSVSVDATAIVTAAGGAGAPIPTVPANNNNSDMGLSTTQNGAAGAAGSSGGAGGAGGTDQGCKHAGYPGNPGTAPGGGGGGGAGGHTCDYAGHFSGGGGANGANGQVTISWE
ncbi:MAG: hypothetical protein WAV23_03410 [Minisyncoccia bacterium]